MPADEREKRHLHNFMHVTTHTSQEWAATFVRCSSFSLYDLLIFHEYSTPNLYICLMKVTEFEISNLFLFSSTSTMSISSPPSHRHVSESLHTKWRKWLFHCFLVVMSTILVLTVPWLVGAFNNFTWQHTKYCIWHGQKNFYCCLNH